MGVIDSEVLQLACVCGVQKQAKLLDKGSAHAPSPCYWVLHGFEPEFKASFIESRTQMDPPKIEVHCAACGENPVVTRI